MTEDARFEDASGAPLRLRALDTDDLRVVSALVQDAVTQCSDLAWKPGQRRFACLLNRFRWEDAAAGRPGQAERVRSVLIVEDASRVRSSGIDRAEADTVLSVLEIAFEPGEDGTGRVVLTLAGDGVIEVAVEALEVTLTDVTRPYPAPSGKEPSHETDALS
jgi:hypothetical protein